MLESEDLNEASTKRKLIEPVLSDLGWDLLGDDVESERQVDIGSGINYVDYALMLNKKPLIFVEGKPFGSELTEKFAKQVLSYSSVERVRWCVLTNGRDWRIFNSEWGSKPTDALLAEFVLIPGKPQPTQLEYLSKSFVVGGNLDRLASESRFAIRLRACISEAIPEIRDLMIRSARNIAYKKLKDEIPGLNRERLDRAIQPLLRVELLAEAAPNPEASAAPTRVVSNRQRLQKEESQEAQHWMTPVRGDDVQTAEACIRSLVGDHSIYAFGDRTPGRKRIAPGDKICFYAVGKGIIAYATVVSFPERKPHPAVRHSDQYPWVFRVEDARLFLERPRPVNEKMRAKLDAFRERDPNGSWAWFVQSTSRLTRHDFELLAGIASE